MTELQKFVREVDANLRAAIHDARRFGQPESAATLDIVRMALIDAARKVEESRHE